LLEYFAADFLTARERFKRAAAERGAHLQSYPIDAPGPNGETLSIDSAYFGDPAPARVLLVSSGIHGVEGFTGSALQIAFTSELAAAAPARTGVLLVHALNPFGFAHLRRANEHNVDLNRNCLQCFPGPANEAYRAFSALLHPPSLRAYGNFFATRLLLRALRRGRAATRQAIAGGQYAFADGLFYGGDRQQPSIDIFEQILTESPVSRARMVIHIDVHTGLGSHGDYQLLPAQSLDTTALQQLRKWFGDGAVVDGGASASANYNASGSVRELSTRALSSARVYALTLEFGTFSPLRVLRVLYQENWLHHHGDSSSVLGRKVKAELLQCFCPRQVCWRHTVLSKGLAVLQQALYAVSEQGA
jgi:Protein of unknown function (DUF2817)